LLLQRAEEAKQKEKTTPSGNRLHKASDIPGRGHALQRIDLYPVRAQTPSSHNQYSRMPRARKRRWRTKLLLGCEQPSIFPVANRLTAGW
jgi:hypothetical protein